MLSKVLSSILLLSLFSCSPDKNEESRQLALHLERNTQVILDQVNLYATAFQFGNLDKPRAEVYLEAVKEARNISSRFMNVSEDTLNVDWLKGKYEIAVERIMDAYVLKEIDTLQLPEIVKSESKELTIALMRNNVVMLANQFVEDCMSYCGGSCSMAVTELLPFRTSQSDSVYSVSLTSDIMFGTKKFPEYLFYLDSIVDGKGERTDASPQIKEYRPSYEVSFMNLDKGAYKAYFRIEGIVDCQYETQECVHEFEIE